MTWIVADVDDGVLREELTRRAAVQWLLTYTGSEKVLERYTYAPGYYGYVVGNAEESDSFAILTRDRLPRWGMKLDDPRTKPLYPVADKPWLNVDREDDEDAH